ncbi:MAG: hypothetical protein R2848_14425 [Thermomicrobiales bacterium]
MGSTIPEGVAEGPDGIYAGGELGQVYRIAPDGTAQQIGMVDGFAPGLPLDTDSNVYICETEYPFGQESNPGGRRVELHERRAGRAFVNPNFPVF